MKYLQKKNVWARILGITSELNEHKQRSDSRILFFSIPEHPSFIHLDFFNDIFKILCYLNCPEKFKWSPLIPMFQLVIFVLSKILVFIDRDGLLADFPLTLLPLPIIDLTVAVEIVTLQFGTCSLTVFFKIQQLIQNLVWNETFGFICSSMNNQMARFLPDYWLCQISSTFAPGKFRRFTTGFFLRNPQKLYF